MWRRRSKYGAVKTVLNGIKFDSKREAARYWELLMMSKAGKIKNLSLQPVFVFPCGIKYKADFQYEESGKPTVEDIKGFRTQQFNLRARMFRHHFPGIEFRITN
jgi:hypothetical protein